MPEPLALRYHGHQFRVYNPEIGDGRGFLFAQLRDGHDRLLDLGTKGSGTTPYSRWGDGRLTLKGGVREILATEMLEALGVNTSKTFSLIETGEQLMRGDEPSPTRSAVMVRLSHSHIRIGTFQRLAALGETGTMERLVDYCLTILYNEAPSDNPAAQLLALAVERIADLAASYMVAGFVHGVLNSDNINITGESFDYGPWRFTEYWDPRFTAAYFDESGLYAFGRQAEAIHWNLGQLAVSLRLMSRSAAADRGARTLSRFVSAARSSAVFCGVWASHHAAKKMTASWSKPPNALWCASKFPSTVSFTIIAAGDVRRLTSLVEMLSGYSDPVAVADDYWSDEQPCSMLIDEVESIWAAIADR